MQNRINIYLFFFKLIFLILLLTALCSLWQPVLLYFKDSWIMLSFFEADKPEWSCTKLRCLNASYNNLEMLPTEISSCSGLVELDASNNKLVAFPSPWECKLVNVPWVLYFSLSNAFTVQLACHAVLGTNFFFLQSTLNLSHNVMVRFAPSVELFWCATLKKLHLDYNQLEEMTESMVKLCK